MAPSGGWGRCSLGLYLPGPGSADLEQPGGDQGVGLTGAPGRALRCSPKASRRGGCRPPLSPRHLPRFQSCAELGSPALSNSATR